jgi:TM2 domain-containing membrane protein YozV
MDGSEKDGVNIVLIAAFLVFALVICGLIGAVVWLYGRQSARRVQQQREKK